MIIGPFFFVFGYFRSIVVIQDEEYHIIVLRNRWIGYFMNKVVQSEECGRDRMVEEEKSDKVKWI